MTHHLPRVVLAVALVLCASGCVGSSDAATGAATDAPTGAPTVALDVPLGQAPLPTLPAPTPALPATVTGVDGLPVQVTDTSRILPLSAGISEVVFALGLGEAVVGRDEATTFAEAVHLPIVTSAHSVNAEGALALAPTVVLTDTFAGPPEALEAIRGAGVPVVVLPEVWTLAEAYPRMEAVAQALGVPDAGAELVARTRADIAAVTGPAQDDADSPTVAFLYLRGTAGVYLLGGDGSGADEVVEAAGGIDAGTALGLDQPFTPLTSESLVQAAPDVLLVMSGGLESVGGIDGLLALPGVAQTPAGRAGAVIAVEDGVLLSFGVRTADVVRHVAAELDRLTARGEGG